MSSFDLKTWIKPLVWIAASALLISRNVESAWVVILLLFSPLVLMPLWFGEPTHLWHRKFAEASAIVLAGAFLRAPGIDTALFAAPWLIARLLHLWETATRWKKEGLPLLPQACMDAAVAFPAIGAAWLVAHRANWTPWNFDPLIVLLTAAHFHHAGLNAKTRPGWLTQSSCVAILAGVPLVAAGITCTHFGVLPFVEPVGVLVLVLGALGVAVSQIHRGLGFGNSVLIRLGFVISGASLFIAMLLALGFGLRHVFPNLTLTMPQMWTIHGTLNAFGFGLCGILAWRGASSPH